MVALWWLKNHGDWSVFVANRVNEINSLVPSQFWRHVPGELNPADLLSRGISPRLFSDSLWWEGPSWLLGPRSNWPIDRLACETSEVEREKRKVSLCNLVAVEGEIPWAVHLELTSSLSTDAVLLSLRRFIARRERPRVIYSDNGTNFRGADGELSDIDWEKVLKLATVQRIIWKFNPPTAAWWGGWWERLVRVLKELLRRTLSNAILTTEDLQTVLWNCESVINSRPLTYLSENSDDLVPLSPAMFLVENRNLDVPDIDYRDTVNLRKRVRYRQKLLNDLRCIDSERSI
ncbi:integrase catalytic domain-containing protein [Trichonephila clavipes]|nr:integrase catalytic domain-containing protein [Trichonephila clavipes]